MKYILKSNAPKEYADWVKADKMSHRPNWKRLRPPLKDTLKETLIIDQLGICCYCECELSDTVSQIEHIKPRNSYALKMFDFGNMLCSCNKKDGSKEPRHCGSSKGNWYDEDLFISPLDQDCEDRFQYGFQGNISPADAEDEAAETTIRILSLDLPKLNKFREKAIEPFLEDDLSDEELAKFVKSYLKIENGKCRPYYTTIKQLFSR